MELREPQGIDGTMTPPPEPPKKRKARKRKLKITSIDPTSSIAVYSNMLIAEQALRKEYQDLQQMRKKYSTFFWTVVLFAIYLTWTGLSFPSIYPWMRLLQRLLAFTCYTVLGLFALTGLYTKVFLVAPRFLSDANKGLRPYNIRIVRQSPSFKERIFRLVNPTYAEHLGGLVKIVPNSSVFSAHFIETWEVYRQEYWERQERKRKRKEKEVKEEKDKKDSHEGKVGRGGAKEVLVK